MAQTTKEILVNNELLQKVYLLFVNEIIFTVKMNLQAFIDEFFCLCFG